MGLKTRGLVNIAHQGTLIIAPVSDKGGATNDAMAVRVTMMTMEGLINPAETAVIFSDRPKINSRVIPAILSFANPFFSLFLLNEAPDNTAIYLPYGEDCLLISFPLLHSLPENRNYIAPEAQKHICYAHWDLNNLELPDNPLGQHICHH